MPRVVLLLLLRIVAPGDSFAGAPAVSRRGGLLARGAQAGDVFEAGDDFDDLDLDADALVECSELVPRLTDRISAATRT